MTSAAEFRRLAGGLLLWSLLPFPFLYVVSPPFWIVAAVAALWRFLRPGFAWRPSTMMQNLIGIVILAAVVAAGGLTVGPLRPLGHLLLLLTAVRVGSIDGMRDFRRALPAVFLVALVGIVSSVHISIAPFLILSFGVWWYAGMRIFLLELSGQAGRDLGRPSRRHAAVAAAAAAVLAIPVFVLLPRLNSPLLGAGIGRQAGFSDSMRLSRGGAIGESGSPAAYVSMADGFEVPLDLLRLRATGFDMITPDTWGPRHSGRTRPLMRDGLVRLTREDREDESLTAMEITLVERERFLFLPPGAVAVDIDEPVLMDPAGGLLPAGREGPPPSYTVWLDPGSERNLQPAEARDLYLPKHDERVCDLAQQVAGAADSEAAKAAAVEAFLESTYDYSLEGRRPGVADPVAWFLFDGRQGHCEFFAAAMAVMLRHQGVHARVVAGYHGGDSPTGDAAVVVRKDNAHAWVEVWLTDEGRWAVYDPTPAEGIDGLVAMGLADRLRSGWQQVEDFFDRRILTFSLGEQIDILEAVFAASRSVRLWIRTLPLWIFLVAAALTILAWALWRMRRLGRVGSGRGPATRVIPRVARRLARTGIDVPTAATVAWIGKAAGRRWPAAEPDIRRLVRRAQEELFGPAEIRSSTDSAEIRRLWRRARKIMA